VTVCLLLAACPPAQSTPVDDTPSLLGGAATIKNATGKAYTFPAPPLDLDQRDTFSLGDHFFNRNWVTAPASTSSFDGLGPTFNATSCSACHLLDGRASPPKQDGAAILGLLFRVSIPGADVHGGPNPVPNYGDQLEPRAILHVETEVVLGLSYVEMPGTFADGETYSLRKPVYEFTQPAYGDFPADMMVSPRIATSMIGLGLLESISEETILSREDPDDADGDGISGHANRVWDVAQQTTTVGRFGWKANQPNIRQQTAGALLGDMGITSRLFPNDNCPGSQTACQDAPNGSDVDAGEPEIDDMKFDSIVDYSHGLAVPARRAWTDAEVLHGEELFTQAGCNACHLTEVQGGNLDRFHNLSNQKLKPFTDLLLHDMGDGLADGRPDYTATGTEWRTAPLWGLGLMELVNGHQNLLHDGRARGPAEAILWHGGEAQRSRDAFVNMSKAERDALVRFLQDL
jgi:CxxC motif-containing protein (DUF1111 family)